MNTKLLRQKILDLAIRGKLTDQRKSDGTARELLERISASHHPERSAKGAKSIDPAPIIPLDKSEAPFEIPDNWEWVKLGDVASDFQYGSAEKSQAEGKVAVLRMGNINRQGLVDYGDLVYTSNDAEIAKYLLNKNDVLFNRTNSPEWVGKTAIYKGEIPAIYAGYIIRIRPHFNSDYLNYLMCSDYERNWSKEVKTDGVHQSNINAQKLMAFAVPLPPLAEQQRIVAKIEEAFAEIVAVEKNKELLKTHIKQTRQKILDLAIHGKLVPQDENDEPASVLLEKILQEKAQTDNKKSPKKKKTDDIATSDNRPYEKIEDAPFEIPENWMWVKLGDVLEIARGGSPRPIQDYLTDDENGLNWIKIGDTEKGGKYIESVKEKIKPSGLSHTRAVKAGDFLLTNSMSFGRPYILKVDGCVHDGWLVLGNVERSLIPDFLYYMLSSDFIYQSFSLSAAGSTVKNLKSETVQATLFPLPPLNEQSRIVSKIEELFSTLDQMERNLI